MNISHLHFNLYRIFSETSSANLKLCVLIIDILFHQTTLFSSILSTLQQSSFKIKCHTNVQRKQARLKSIQFNDMLHSILTLVQPMLYLRTNQLTGFYISGTLVENGLLILEVYLTSTATVEQERESQKSSSIQLPSSTTQSNFTESCFNIFSCLFTVNGTTFFITDVT